MVAHSKERHLRQSQGIQDRHKGRARASRRENQPSARECRVRIGRDKGCKEWSMQPAGDGGHRDKGHIGMQGGTWLSLSLLFSVLEHQGSLPGDDSC